MTHRFCPIVTPILLGQFRVGDIFAGLTDKPSLAESLSSLDPYFQRGIIHHAFGCVAFRILAFGMADKDEQLAGEGLFQRDTLVSSYAMICV